ncbi:MAG: MFS transporter [Candidatus Omnitrophota bacterium]
MDLAGRKTDDRSGLRRLAYQFIILMGLISLFGDIVYEGGRSIIGPYLSTLGASAAIVGLIAGIGEFAGYFLRLPFGYLADRSRAYWPLTILGYGLILAVPLLGFAGSWQIAAVFIIAERLGKAIRSPARDAMLSYATKHVGRGFGFGLHEAMDQIGAIIGPLFFSAVFLLKGSYRQGFSILWAPAILVLLILMIARRKVASPQELEMPRETAADVKKEKLPHQFWIYVIFIFLSVAGLVNFPLIAYHINAKNVVATFQIPLLYAAAMALDGIAALIIGRIYDKAGLRSLMVIPFITFPVSFLGFSGSYGSVVAGIALWGIVMGIHETIMRSAIADLSSLRQRGLAYGVFNTVYGLAWFAGSAAVGFLYEISLLYVILFAAVMEMMALVTFFFFKKRTL